MHTSPDVDEALFCSLISRRRILPKDVISDIATKIQPVIRHEGTLKYIYLGHQDVHHVSFLTNPHQQEVEPPLKEHSTIHTLHRYGFPRLFKPTIAEAVIMFPIDLPSDVVAFEVIGPRSDADRKRQSAAIEKGFHVATTIFYTQ